MQLPEHVSSPLSEGLSGMSLYLLFISLRGTNYVAKEPGSPIKRPLSPDSALSDVPPPLSKKSRSSQSDSSLSEADDDEDEEDQPLAARIPLTTANGNTSKKRSLIRGGKKTSGKKGLSKTTLPSEQPHSATEGAKKMNGKVNGISHEARVKFEERLDDRQLSRLATGVTVDTGTTAQTPVSILQELLSNKYPDSFLRLPHGQTKLSTQRCAKE